MPEVREREDAALAGIPRVSSEQGCSRILDRAGKPERFVITHKRRPSAVAMRLDVYEREQNRIVELERMLDHVLLYVEIQVRKSDRRPNVSLATLRKRHAL